MKYFKMSVIADTKIARVSELYAVNGRVSEFLGYAIERPYLSNRPNVSSIPRGEYELKEHKSPSKNQWIDGAVLVIINESLGVGFQEGDAARFLCYFHSANKPAELQGCIAPGLGLHPTEWAVVDSRQAFKVMLDYFRNGWTKLVIE